MKTTEPITEPTEPIFKLGVPPDLEPSERGDAVAAGAPAAPRNRTRDAALEPHWLDAIDAATD